MAGAIGPSCHALSHSNREHPTSVRQSWSNPVFRAELRPEVPPDSNPFAAPSFLRIDVVPPSTRVDRRNAQARAPPSELD
jgi:hypothetical protein